MLVIRLADFDFIVKCPRAPLDDWPFFVVFIVFIFLQIKQLMQLADEAPVLGVAHF
jgi:hypothetical protein